MLAQVLKKNSGFDSKIIFKDSGITPMNRRSFFSGAIGNNGINGFQNTDRFYNQDVSPQNTIRDRNQSKLSRKSQTIRLSQFGQPVQLYQKNLEESVSFFSKLTFAWTIEILKIGRKAYNQQRNLQASDLFDCSLEETPEFAHELMERHFSQKMKKESKKYLQEKVELIQEIAKEKNERKYDKMNYIKQEQEQSNNKKKLDQMLYQTIKFMNSKDYIIATILSILGSLCQFVGPILLSYIIKFLKSETQEDWIGYVYATAIFVGYLLRVFLLQHSLQLTNKVGIKVLNALNTAIYSKILRLSSSSKKYYDAGKTMNLVTVDSQSIFGYVMMAQNMITAPIMVVVSVGFIIYELGIIGLATPVFFIIGAYLQKIVNAKAFKLRRIILSWTDKRSKQLNEFFENIRVIKFYGWEDMISKRILDIRAVETTNLLKNQIIKTVVEVIMNSTPIVISLFIFGLYAGLYGDLEPAKAYTVISLLNLLLNPLKMIVIVLLLQQNATTSTARISEFFMAEEQDPEFINKIESQDMDIGCIQIVDASFSWDSLQSALHNSISKFSRRVDIVSKNSTVNNNNNNINGNAANNNIANGNNNNNANTTNNKIDGNNQNNNNNNMLMTAQTGLSKDTTVNTKMNGKMGNKIVPLQQFRNSIDSCSLNGMEQLCLRDLSILKNINLHMESGDVAAIVGQVASGKSSLLLAILGEMIHTAGTLQLNGSIAYVPQSTWLQNATLRDNIIFGLPFDEDKYERIIEKCQLKADLMNKEVFPNGDLTEIGERGVNLSGGQRQRIGIARAVYADSDIYLVDDCLSALDAQVAKLIYYEVLMGELEGKTLIFVTHALHFIEDVKKIVVLKDGEIVNQGCHEYLQKHCKEYQKLTLLKQEEIANDVDELDEEEEECSYTDEDGDEDDEEDSSISDSDSESEQDHSSKNKNNKIRNHHMDDEQSSNSDRSPIRNQFNNFDAMSIDYQQERVQLKRKDRRVRNEVQAASENIPDFNFTDLRERGLKIQEECKSIHSSNRRQSRQVSRQVSRVGSKASLTPRRIKSKFSAFKRTENKKDSVFDLSHLENKKKEFQESAVPYSIYKRYINSGGLCATFNMFMSFVLAQTFKVLSDWWIGQWSSDVYEQQNTFYIIIFFIFGGLQGIFIYLRGYTFGIFTINSSNKFQNLLVNKLLHTPQWWYDITPIGKIISRTTKDQDDMDSTLPWNMKFALTNIIQLITVVITISIIFPHFIALGIICFYGYLIIIRFYLITAREIKKIEASTRAPVISHFQETTNGILIIRAFKRQQLFMAKMLQKQRDYIVSFINQNQCNRWVSVVTDLMGLLIVASCAYFSVLSRSFNIISNPSLTGLALSQSFQISQIISFTLKLLADTESNMNSLVRILSLADKNPQESSWDDKKAPQNWPSHGEITFKNVSLKYRPELPQIVNNLSIQFEKNQKIGVVGRTGCGKSTLTLGILRILEITFDQSNEMGKILLDGIDISELGLHELRQKVTIIPQDPILFSGTLRSNIDPFNQYSDQVIVEMLKKVNIWDSLDKIIEKQQDNKKRDATQLNKNQPGGGRRMNNMNVSEIREDQQSKLNLQVESGGANFSLGQRQLICIARALIKKPKVLLMDEATASIDEMTDVVIQNLIKQELKNATVITIAHRLKTIMQYDKILVLDKGNLKEFDTPTNLLNKEQSFFRNLVIENGLIFLEEMKQLAAKKENESAINAVAMAQNTERNITSHDIPGMTQQTDPTIEYTFSCDQNQTNQYKINNLNNTFNNNNNNNNKQHEINGNGNGNANGYSNFSINPNGHANGKRQIIPGTFRKKASILINDTLEDNSCNQIIKDNSTTLQKDNSNNNNNNNLLSNLPTENNVTSLNIIPSKFSKDNEHHS